MARKSKEKVRLSKEDIQKAKEVNLVDYCITNNIPLLKERTRNPSLAEHDSLVFYPDNKNRQWNRHSTGQGGDAIDFIQFYESRHLPEGEKVSFQYAVNKLLDNDYESVPKTRPPVPDFEYENNEVKDFKRAKDYLVNERGINEALVSVLIDKGIIAQDKRNNVVFKWIDHEQDGKVVGANEQGTGKVKEGERSFKKTQRHSTSGKGFNLRIGEPKNVKFFESAIDLLSYADIHQEQMEDEWLVSMEGLKHTVVMETLSSCSRYSNKHDDYHIESVSFCVDNDEAGKEFADKYIGKLSIIDPNGNKPFTLEVPENSKDWNDELLFLKEEEKHINNQLMNEKKGEMKMSDMSGREQWEEEMDELLKLNRTEQIIQDKENKVYYYEGENAPKQVNTIDDISRYNEHADLELIEGMLQNNPSLENSLEKVQKNQYLAHEGVWINPTKEQLEEYNEVHGIDGDEYLQGFVGRDQQPQLYIYDGFSEPEKVETFEDITVESNHLGDLTDEFQEEVEWHMEVDTLEEMQENQFFAEYAVWVNPTKEQLEEYNDSVGLDKKENLRDFEGHEQLFETRETQDILYLDDELEI